MKVVKVTQFFDFKGMTWKELTGTKEHPVLLTEDKTHCLWKENPKIVEVKESESPICGNVWLKEGKGGEIEIYKTNYDTSD